MEQDLPDEYCIGLLFLFKKVAYANLCDFNIARYITTYIDGEELLYSSMRKNNVELAEFLLGRSRCRVKHDVLLTATALDRHDMTRLLRDYGADIAHTSEACVAGYMNILERYRVQPDADAAARSVDEERTMFIWRMKLKLDILDLNMQKKMNIRKV